MSLNRRPTVEIRPTWCADVNLAIPRFALLLMVTVIAAFNGAALTAHAASIERRSDGSVIVTAFGERMAFREQDAKRILFAATEYKCLYRGMFAVGIPLDWILTDPELDQCWKNTIPEGSFLIKPQHDRNQQPLELIIDLTYENGRLYPGGIEVEKEIADRINDFRGLVIHVQGDPSRPELVPYDIVPVQTDLGFVAYKEKPRSTGEGTTFILPVENRVALPKKIFHRVLKIYCSFFNECFVGEYSDDDNVSISLKFHTLPLTPDRQNIPQPSWLQLDVVARKIAQAIFIDRPEGDFQ